MGQRIAWVIQARHLAATGDGRDTRIRARLSCKDVADLAGISAATVWRYEQRKQRPTGDAAERYAHAVATIERLAKGAAR